MSEMPIMPFDGTLGHSVTAGTAPSFAATGASLELLRRELMRCGPELSRLLEPAYGETVAEVMRSLEGQVCRIAVVGQVKAGKSSFISALVGRPHLLPSDVNPWTTVVTSLHFRDATAPNDRAVFTLFDADEWQRIAEGGGALRELTERLVPGFNTELLRLQLETMRRRTEQRLGPDFTSMLSQRHEFSSITRPLLERYVSAGHDGLDPATDVGRFSDITKSADLYFDTPRPGFPVSLIDTPGTNDPLLVRDEITRQSLGSADIYIVVLTAQQPLSAGDLALLRILRGLHKERVIIFINRIDGLRDIAGDAERVASHVKARLREEFPAARIPIIVGSAWWANCALTGHPGDVARAMTPTFQAYARHFGAPVFSGDPAQPPPSPSAVVQTLMHCSGLPSVCRAISDLMSTGNNAHLIRQLSAYLLELARSQEATERSSLRSLERVTVESRAVASDRARNAQVWRQELEQLTAASQQMQESVGVFKSSLDRLTERCVTDLRSLLGQCISRYTEEAVSQLAVAYDTNASRAWRCDPAPLRDDLQVEFLRVFRHWEGKLLQTDQAVRGHLRALSEDGVLRGVVEVANSATPGFERYPDLSSIGSQLALDLSHPWWAAWWRGRPSLSSRTIELRRLLRAEFVPVIDELAAVASQSLGHRASLMVRQISTATLDVVNTLHQRRAELLGQLESGDPNGNGGDPSVFASRFDAARTRVEAWTALRASLQGLADRGERLAMEPALIT